MNLPLDCIRDVSAYVPEILWPRCMQVCNMWYRAFNYVKINRGGDDIADGNIMTYRHYMRLLSSEQFFYPDFALTLRYGYIGLAREMLWLFDLPSLRVAADAERLSLVRPCGDACDLCKYSVSIIKLMGIGRAYLLCNVAYPGHHTLTAYDRVDITPIEAIIKTPMRSTFKQYLSTYPAASTILYILDRVVLGTVPKLLQCIPDLLLKELANRVYADGAYSYRLRDKISIECYKRWPTELLPC